MTRIEVPSPRSISTNKDNKYAKNLLYSLPPPSVILVEFSALRIFHTPETFILLRFSLVRPFVTTFSCLIVTMIPIRKATFD